VEAFESEMAEYCGTALGIGVASGTDALHLALLACGIGEDDEVLTTPFTFIATAESIHKCGASPVFVDIEPDTCNMDPGEMRRHLTSRTKCIVPVHLYGHPCDMTQVMEFASAHGLRVIEDCAQSLGATWQGAKAGSLGDAGCLSFFPSKVLGAYGDGGMVITSDATIADHVRVLRSHGSKRKYFHDMPGFNSRLDALQAAILRVKLRHLDAWLERRRELAGLYASLLSDVEGIHLPTERSDARHVYNYYVVRVAGGAQRRDALAAHLKAQDIATAVYYPRSLHLQPVYAFLGHARGDFPVSEAAQDEMLSLPMYPELTDRQLEHIAHAIASFPALRRVR
jgi:dTDP-4-amino-4,6-dideoxygalactose transaminase